MNWPIAASPRCWRASSATCASSTASAANWPCSGWTTKRGSSKALRTRLCSTGTASNSRKTSSWCCKGACNPTISAAGGGSRCSRYGTWPQRAAGSASTCMWCCGTKRPTNCPTLRAWCANSRRAARRRTKASRCCTDCACASGCAAAPRMRPLSPNCNWARVQAFTPAMPLNPNGKVERKALPAPERSRNEASGAVSTPPRTPTEQTLATLWTEVLRVDRVGREDNFFALGGHSLLATQLVSRIRGTLGVELPLKAMFDAPTLEALAARVDETHPSGGMRIPALRPVERIGATPLSFAQQRLWFLDQLDPGSASYNVPVVLRLEGELDIGALEKSFHALVRRHEALRTTFHQEEGQPVQRISPPADVSFAVVELGELPGDHRDAEALRLVGEEARRPFELARGPLFRVTLLRLSEHAHVLVLNMHHIVSDGWSMGVLIKEVAALYPAFLRGEASPLPALPVQYADYAVWQRQWLRGDVLDAQLAWWKQLLAGNAPLELPTDRPRPAVQSYRGAHLPVSLPRELAEGLKALAQKEGVTPFMLLLAAWQGPVHPHSGQRDISVGSPTAGSRQGGGGGGVGFFVNTLALRSQVRPEASFRELLAQVKATTLGAYVHQDVPFERLGEELKPERDQSRSPLFQVMFALPNPPMPELVMGPLRLSPMEVEFKTAKFDLSLALTETPEGLRGVLEYNTDLFVRGTAERMMSHL